jgi:hypothetical protein
MKSTLITGVAFALIYLPAAVYGSDIISGADAQAILAARAAGTQWCQIIEQIKDATTGAVLQQTCRCVASVEGMGGGNPPGNEVLMVAFGPEQPCPVAGIRPDRPQIGDARA